MFPNVPKIIARRLTASQRPYSRESDNNAQVLYYDNKLSVTEFINALSLLFPEGEAYFVRAVATFSGDSRVKQDSELCGNVKLFIAQEVQHSAEHFLYNEVVCNDCHSVNAITRLVSFFIYELFSFITIYSYVKWTLSIPKLTGLFDFRYSALAVTCSLEHFTATLAEILLTTENGKHFLSSLSNSHRTIWIWHAIEETEHKAVAYDVYHAVGGSYLFRIYWHIITTIVFLITVTNIYLWLMYDRGKLFAWRHHKELFQFLFIKPGFLAIVFPLWAQYLSPDFHPWGGGNDPTNHQYKSNTLAIEAISKYTRELQLVPMHSSSNNNSAIPIEVQQQQQQSNTNSTSTNKSVSRSHSTGRGRSNSKQKIKANKSGSNTKNSNSTSSNSTNRSRSNTPSKTKQSNSTTASTTSTTTKNKK